MDNPQMLIALTFMIVTAVSLIYIGSYRLLRHIQLGKRHEETLKTHDAAAFPIHGSMALFTLYVLLRFIPRTYINALLMFYLGVGGIFALNNATRHAIRTRTMWTGILSIVLGVLYFYYKHWTLTNVLAFGICITAIAEVRIQSFLTSSVLLVGLFFYDIFWVFGTDVMLSVATGVDGPIKILFPQTLFGDHSKLSLLGLGDMVIPGFFLSQTLIFSVVYAKKGTLYFRIAMAAYFLSLVNTMAVMMIFKHGQPALLYIVPWLLIATYGAALLNGDISKMWSFDMDEVQKQTIEERKAKQVMEGAKTSAEKEEQVVIDSISALVWMMVRDLFGLEPDDLVDSYSTSSSCEANKKTNKTVSKNQESRKESKEASDSVGKVVRKASASPQNSPQQQPASITKKKEKKAQ